MAGLEFLGLLVSKLTGDRIDARFVPYALIGAFGLIVHIAVLKATLQTLDLGFARSQALATLTAMIGNFLFNNMLTYKDLRLRGLRALKGLAVFCLIGAIGFLANIGIASWLYGERPVWWMAGVAGALMGAVWNYAMSSRLVWRLR